MQWIAVVIELYIIVCWLLREHNITWPFLYLINNSRVFDEYILCTKYVLQDPCDLAIIASNSCFGSHALVSRRTDGKRVHKGLFVFAIALVPCIRLAHTCPAPSSSGHISGRTTVNVRQPIVVFDAHLRTRSELAVASVRYFSTVFPNAFEHAPRAEISTSGGGFDGISVNVFPDTRHCGPCESAIRRGTTFLLYTRRGRRVISVVHKRVPHENPHVSTVFRHASIIDVTATGTARGRTCFFWQESVRLHTLYGAAVRRRRNASA